MRAERRRRKKQKAAKSQEKKKSAAPKPKQEPTPEPVETALTKAFGVQAAIEGDVMHLNQSLADVRDVVSRFQGLDEHFTMRRHQEYFKTDFAGDDEEGFCGGTFEDLQRGLLEREVDVQPVERAREKFAGYYINKFNHATFKQKRRKRRFSEHDGDWDQDRQWEIQPFAATYKSPQAVKCIEIEAELSAAGIVSAERIDEYAGYIVALVELVERQGVSVDLKLTMPSRNTCPGKADRVRYKMQVKKPGEYLTTQDLKAVFSTNWMRRYGFSMLALAADIQDVAMNFGFGNPDPSNEAVKATSAGLLVSPTSYDPDVEKVMEELNKVLN